MVQLILGIVACAIAFYVGYNVRAKEENDSKILNHLKIYLMNKLQQKF